MATFRDSPPAPPAPGLSLLSRPPGLSRDVDTGPRIPTHTSAQRSEAPTRNSWMRPEHSMLAPMPSGAPPQAQETEDGAAVDEDLDLKLNGTLTAISKAADLLALMHQRSMELQQDAEQRVYEARKDTVKAEERVVELEQTVTQLENDLKDQNASLQMSQARIEELEQQLADSIARRRVVESAIRARDEAICVLQLAIDDRLTSSVRKFEGMKAPLFKDFDHSKR